jgi:hypothetical protein
LIRPGGGLEAAEGDVESDERVLARARKVLRVARDAGFDARERREHDQQQDEKREKRDRDDERETAATAEGASKVRRLAPKTPGPLAFV